MNINLKKLHDLGQSLWFNNISRELPTSGTLTRYIEGCAEAVLEEFRREGVDDEAVAARLQCEAADAFAALWHAVLPRLAHKSAQFTA